MEPSFKGMGEKCGGRLHQQVLENESEFRACPILTTMQSQATKDGKEKRSLV